MNGKTIIISVLLLAFASFGHAQAQDAQTLFDGEVSYGGFGAPVVKFSEVNGDLGVWVGGRGGWIINFGEIHALSLGLGGYGLTTLHQVPDPDLVDVPAGDYYGLTGYGGFEVEYTNRSYRLVHLTASSLIGAGGVLIRDRDFLDIDEDPDPFFVIEPGLQAELNVATFFRVAAGVSYRLTSGVERAGFTDGDFSGVNGMITFKFGSFL